MLIKNLKGLKYFILLYNNIYITHMFGFSKSSNIIRSSVPTNYINTNGACNNIFDITLIIFVTILLLLYFKHNNKENKGKLLNLASTFTI